MNITIYRAAPLTPDIPAHEWQLPEGFPYLVDDDSLEVIEPALLYLSARFTLRGKYKAENTLEAAAYDLCDWFRFIGDDGTAGRSWTDVDASVVARYRDARLTTVSPQTHELRAPKTVRRRVARALDFYDWARSAGHFEGRMDMSDVRTVPSSMDNAVLAHTYSSSAFTQQAVSTMLPEDKSTLDEHVEILTADEWVQVRAELGPLPSRALKDGDLRPSRDRIAAELSISTGLRVDEVAQLTIYQILDLRVPDDASDSDIIRLKVTKTKRLVPRTVEVPAYLVKELQLYIDGERNLALAEAKKYWLRGKTPKPGAMFVNGTSARNHAGRAIKADTLTRAFHDAVIRAGLVCTVEKTDPETGQHYTASAGRFWFHCLRHTFAMFMYRAEKAAGNAEPWKVIQSLLGHKFLSTTLNTYLKHAQDDRRAVNAIVFSAIREKFSGH